MTEPISAAVGPETSADASVEKFEAWGFVELMGHQRAAGKLSERSIAGRNLLQVDIPLDSGGFRTVFYGGGAIYALHPTDEAAARKLAAGLGNRPMYAYEFTAHPRIERDGYDQSGG